MPGVPFSEMVAQLPSYDVPIEDFFVPAAFTVHQSEVDLFDKRLVIDPGAFGFGHFQSERLPVVAWQKRRYSETILKRFEPISANRARHQLAQKCRSRICKSRGLNVAPATVQVLERYRKPNQFQKC